MRRRLAHCCVAAAAFWTAAQLLERHMQRVPSRKTGLWGVLLGNRVGCGVSSSLYRRSHRTRRAAGRAAAPRSSPAPATTQPLAPRVFCFVPCRWGRDREKIRVIIQTWGAQCNTLALMVSSSETLPSHGIKGAHIVALNLTRPDTYDNLWEKVHLSVRYLHDTHIDDADWFVKVDTDSFLYVNHLREYLKGFDPNQALYLGKEIFSACSSARVAYNSGAGYVLSQKALVQVTGKLQHLKTVANWPQGKPLECIDTPGVPEDVSMAVCLRDAGVFSGDTRDTSSRDRFFLNTREYENRHNVHCCAEDAILFHSYKSAFSQSFFHQMELMGR
jgi:hypothetical protein